VSDAPALPPELEELLRRAIADMRGRTGELRLQVGVRGEDVSLTLEWPCYDGTRDRRLARRIGLRIPLCVTLQE
jgi:hypothetical protein